MSIEDSQDDKFVDLNMPMNTLLVEYMLCCMLSEHRPIEMDVVDNELRINLTRLGALVNDRYQICNNKNHAEMVDTYNNCSHKLSMSQNNNYIEAVGTSIKISCKGYKLKNYIN